MESNMETPGLRIALWTVNSNNPNAPKFNGEITIDGKVHKVSLWENLNALNPKAPILKGKTSRPAPKLETVVIGESDPSMPF
jgi:hypothetical protein